ncbi:hypothetical protein BHE74_00028862 [Ensete ventricosum]|nr:hypothetical protein BHE74_00028862 [Ensete ventricosum]RZS13983.1 hypothetical protein BHM03_00045627 [Ensete ventricosum]
MKGGGWAAAFGRAAGKLWGPTSNRPDEEEEAGKQRGRKMRQQGWQGRLGSAGESRNDSAGSVGKKGQKGRRGDQGYSWQRRKEEGSSSGRRLAATVGKEGDGNGCYGWLQSSVAQQGRSRGGRLLATTRGDGSSGGRAIVEGDSRGLEREEVVASA